MIETPTLPASRPSLDDVELAAETPEIGAEAPRKSHHKAGGGEPTENRRNRYRIPGYAVNEGTANMTMEDRVLIRWVHDYALRNDIPAGELLKKVGGKKKGDAPYYSAASVYQFLTGRRIDGMGLEPMRESAQALKQLVDSRSSVKRAPFIETSLSARIFKVCEAALDYQKVVFVYGESQIGKTCTFEEFERRHPGTALHFEMPAGGNFCDFIREFAGKVGEPSTLPVNLLRLRIKAAIDDRMLIIVDQAHECFRTLNSRRLPMPLLFMMELYNKKKCGVVISGTDVLEEGMTKGVHRKVLRQLGLRGLGDGLKLPSRPTRQNLREFAASFGLGPVESADPVKISRTAYQSPAELQEKVISEYSLGFWLTILSAGAQIATKRGEQMEWRHVVYAKGGLDALSVPIADDDEGGAA